MTTVDPFEIVLVCTGNRFRSALAEHLMRTAADGLPVDVRSLGTLDLGEVAALPEAIELGRELGLDLSAHRARALQDEQLGNVDLVIGFERRHVASAVVDGGAPRERTFTIGELAALLRAIEPPHADALVDRARRAVAAAHELRQRYSGSAPLTEIGDPLGQPPEVYRATAIALRDLAPAIVRDLFGSRTRRMGSESSSP
jgi:protein-tyrosine phosphatase